MPRVSVVPSTSWLDEVREHGPASVGQAFGLTFVERPPGNLSPCPACSAETRHPSRRDRRGAVGLTPNGAGWRCHECGASGDAITLAAWLAVCRVPAKGEPAWRDIRAACASRGLCSPDPRDARTAPQAHLRPVPPPRPQAPPKRPPAGEVAAAWDACLRVTDDDEVVAWLASRGLDARRVEDLDLARAVPAAGLPTWMRCRRRDRADLAPSWLESSYRLAVPFLGPTGRLESLHARALDAAAEPKAASPAGAEVRGLVMADPGGAAMLRGEFRPPLLVIAEGVPDFLTWAAWGGDSDESAPAVLGIVAGSWTDEIAERVPTGLPVAVRTHRDLPDPAHPGKRPAGLAYADRICASLARRCEVYRFPPEGT